MKHGKNHTNIIDDEYKNPHFIRFVCTPSYPQKFQLTQLSDIPDILPRIFLDYKIQNKRIKIIATAANQWWFYTFLSSNDLPSLKMILLVRNRKIIAQ